MDLQRAQPYMGLHVVHGVLPPPTHRLIISHAAHAVSLHGGGRRAFLPGQGNLQVRHQALPPCSILGALHNSAAPQGGLFVQTLRRLVACAGMMPHRWWYSHLMPERTHFRIYRNHDAADSADAH